MKFSFFLSILIGILSCVQLIQAEIPTIETDVQTDFAVYTPYSKKFVPSVRKYTIKEDLSNIMFADKYTFSVGAIDSLVKNGFVAVPSKTDKIYEVYGETREAGLPVFVTTDAMLHTFHIIYDYILRIAEHERFYFQLDSMLTGMKSEIEPLLAWDGDDSLETAVLRTAAFLEVAHKLLTGEETFNDDSIKTWVADELELIEKHEGPAYSNVIKDLEEDFSQYIPRGHYTRNERFEKFFRSMMYLGRMNFRLGTEDDPGSSRIETMQACILTKLLAVSTIDGKNVSELWEKIYRPTVFFVGRSDDLNFKDYKEVLDRILGEDWVNEDIGIIHTNLDTILTELRKLRPPMILSGLCDVNDDPQEVTKGFRIMGQRFIPDSYMFGKLVKYPTRLMPKGLDIFAVLGSQRAYDHLTELTYNEDECEGYLDSLNMLIQEFESKPASQWAENLYWNWLYTLLPLLDEPGDGFPFFMTTEAWADKTLTTASGSWAELRHDTILYAKQSYTPIGINLASGPLHQGYVEPNPEVFARLAALSEFMQKGFSDCELTSILPLDKLNDLSDLCFSLRDIAIKELEGGNITSREYNDIIGGIGAKLENLEDFGNPFSSSDEDPYGVTSEADTTMAVIADVHTDPNTQRVLEVGVGKAMDIYVAVPVEGIIVLCRGSMFSYYEFKWDMSDRLTDEKWQGMLAENTAPAMPEWTWSFIFDSTQNQTLGRKPNVKTIDVVINNVYRENDLVDISITSESKPEIVISWTTDEADIITKDMLILPDSLGDNKYSAQIPQNLLSNDSLLVVIRTEGDEAPPLEDPEARYEGGYFRKLLKKTTAGSAVINVKNLSPCRDLKIIGRTFYLPYKAKWSVYDIAGRKLITIPEGLKKFVLPVTFSSKILFIVVEKEGLSRSYKVVIK